MAGPLGASSLSRLAHLNNSPKESDPRPPNSMHGTVDIALVYANELYCWEITVCWRSCPSSKVLRSANKETWAISRKQRSATLMQVSSTLSLSFRQVETTVQHRANLPALFDARHALQCLSTSARAALGCGSCQEQQIDPHLEIVLVKPLVNQML